MSEHALCFDSVEELLVALAASKSVTCARARYRSTIEVARELDAVYGIREVNYGKQLELA